jgi:hypothetical protein
VQELCIRRMATSPNPFAFTTRSLCIRGGQNITIRRITNVSMSPPATLAVGAHSWVFAQVSFDDGKTESPVADLSVMTSSDTGVVRVGSGNGQGPAFSEGVKAGIASVSGRYFGVSTAMFQVQVVR